MAFIIVPPAVGIGFYLACLLTGRALRQLRQLPAGSLRDRLLAELGLPEAETP